MAEVVSEQSEANTVTLTKARLEAVLQETRKDEAKLQKVLELRSLRRRLRARGGGAGRNQKLGLVDP